jgi:CheY-like chemotaxis protein
MSKTILVVDDDPVIRTLLVECMSCFGHKVSAVESGAMCLDSLKGELPDILFLDLQMPDMTGLEVLKHIRANDKTARMPVIMLSANSDSAAVNSDDQAKATCYVQKPFNMKDILALLETL